MAFPSEQVDLLRAFDIMRERLGAARTSRNELVEETIQAEMESFRKQLAASPRHVTRWVCLVQKVLSASELDCEMSKAVFHVKLKEPNPTVLSTIQGGWCVQISGGMEREMSITVSGAIREPELAVIDAEVELCSVALRR